MKSRKFRIAFWSFIIVLSAIYMSLSANSSILKKYNVSYQIIDFSSNRYVVYPVLSTKKDGVSFELMLKGSKPVAAITGTYFDSSYTPLGDLYKNGKYLRRGSQRQGIGFTKSGKILFIERKGISKINWNGCFSGIACGPRIIRNGKISINVEHDGFSSAASTKMARRCIVGASKDNKLIFCEINDEVTLKKSGEIMLALGAYNAVNMDGGMSCALYKDGKMAVEPIVNLSNILIVKLKEKYTIMDKSKL